MPTIQLSTVIAKHIRAFREDAQATQQEIAEQMIQKGFPWRRETVAQSEGESRTVAIGELLALGSIFGRSLDSFIIPRDDMSGGVVRPQRIDVAITSEMILRRSELIRLIRAGAPAQLGRADKDRQRLTAEISSLEMKLTRTDTRLEEIEQVRKRLISNLEKRKSQLMDLESKASDDPC